MRRPVSALASGFGSADSLSETNEASSTGKVTCAEEACYNFPDKLIVGLGWTLSPEDVSGRPEAK